MEIASTAKVLLSVTLPTSMISVMPLDLMPQRRMETNNKTTRTLRAKTTINVLSEETI